MLDEKERGGLVGIGRPATYISKTGELKNT